MGFMIIQEMYSDVNVYSTYRSAESGVAVGNKCDQVNVGM